MSDEPHHGIQALNDLSERRGGGIHVFRFNGFNDRI
jgi:hypothetical protein